MRLHDLLRHAIENLLDRKLRTSLTLAGIIIGTSALASLQAFVEGARANVLERWDRAGMTSQFGVSPRGAEGWPGARRQRRKENQNRDADGTAAENAPSTAKAPGAAAAPATSPVAGAAAAPATSPVAAEAGTSPTAETSRRKLDRAALDEIRALPGVRLVLVPRIRPVTAVVGDREIPTLIAGAPPEIPGGAGFYKLLSGVDLPPPAATSPATTAPSAAPPPAAASTPAAASGSTNTGKESGAASSETPILIGKRLADELGFHPETSAIGATIRIKWEELTTPVTRFGLPVPGLAERSLDMRVCGLIDAGTAFLTVGPFRGVVGSDVADRIQPASLEALRAMSSGGDEVPSAVVFLEHGAKLEDLEKRVRDLGFSTRSALDFIAEAGRAMLYLQTILACLGGVALAVAGLGIANTFLTAVYERTHEIGVRRAVGARRGDIRRQFLFEAGLLGLCGAAAGILLAWAGNRWIATAVFRWISEGESVPDQFYIFTPRLIAACIGFAVAISVVASFYPASRAARLNPVDSLRHE